MYRMNTNDLQTLHKRQKKLKPQGANCLFQPLQLISPESEFLYRSFSEASFGAIATVHVSSLRVSNSALSSQLM